MYPVRLGHRTGRLWGKRDEEGGGWTPRLFLSFRYSVGRSWLLSNYGGSRLGQSVGRFVGSSGCVLGVGHFWVCAWAWLAGWLDGWMSSSGSLDFDNVQVEGGVCAVLYLSVELW